MPRPRPAGASRRPVGARNAPPGARERRGERIHHRRSRKGHPRCRLFPRARVRSGRGRPSRPSTDLAPPLLPPPPSRDGGVHEGSLQARRRGALGACDGRPDGSTRGTSLFAPRATLDPQRRVLFPREPPARSARVERPDSPSLAPRERRPTPPPRAPLPRAPPLPPAVPPRRSRVPLAHFTPSSRLAPRLLTDRGAQPPVGWVQKRHRRSPRVVAHPVLDRG